MKRILTILLTVVLLASLFASCGGKDKKPSDETDATATPTCTVILSGSGMSNVTVEKGASFAKPADPQKADSIFGGWYVDSGYSSKATFPMTINGDTTLYARFYSYQEAFVAARNATVGAAVPGYEYNYTLAVSASYAGVSAALRGNSVGNAKYSSTGDVSFYDEHTNSGILFYDGSEYQIRRADTLQKISLDENDLLRKYSVEEVGDSYRFDASSFAKAIFEFDEGQLKEIVPTGTDDEYKLNTGFTASKGIALVGNNLNNTTVKRLIGQLPETSVETGIYVTFSDGELKTYRYEMNINVTSIQFSLVYSLTFRNTGAAQTIVPKTFVGLSLSPEQISASADEINGYLSSFITAERSGYDFKVKTGVDFPSSNEINATFQGSALRKIVDGTVYFHNDIEIDSDLKNADLYKSANIADVHVKRTRLTDGSVWLIEKKLLTDATTQITPYTENNTDSRYLFDVLTQADAFTFVQKLTKGSTVTYSIGVSSAKIADMMTWLNGELDLDPLGNATADATVFGSFNAATVSADEVKITLVVKDGAFDSLTIESDGTFATAFPGSRDFTAFSDADYNFSLSLTVNKNGSTFEPFSDVKKAK